MLTQIKIYVQNKNYINNAIKIVINNIKNSPRGYENEQVIV